MREIRLRDEGGYGPVRYLLVRVGRSHDPIHVAHEDRSDLKRAKLAMTATRMIIPVGFDLDKCG